MDGDSKEYKLYIKMKDCEEYEELSEPVDLIKE